MNPQRGVDIMSNVELFKFEGQEVRTVLKDDEVWFVGKDVTDVLGYQNGSRDINRHVFEDDRQTISLNDGVQSRQTIIINESGLYALIFGSRLESAQRFKHWVTSEVLPSVRKHGAYMTDQVLEKTLQDPDFMIGLLTQLKDEREKRTQLEVKSKQQEQQIAEMKPKADYVDNILKSGKSLTVKQISADYGMTSHAMNKLLHELGVQYKQSKQWFLYKKYLSSGYTKSETYIDRYGCPHMYTKWTQKGRLFLYELLKRNGVLPLMEQDNIELEAA